MVENSSGSPVFAGRYRFQPVGDDWDRGRSGFTHLVFDIQKERLGVIKRAETKSHQAVEGLKNEVAALLDLKGQGVPEVYDTGEAEYGSKNYFYMVMEYIEGIRVENNLDTITAPERAKILTQFFSILAKAHEMGIVNGDVDLKHLFWRRDQEELVVIDWGNARLDVDPVKKSKFAYDLARAAEIIYSLVTLQGYPPAKGSLALPDDSKLIPGLAPLPMEFRDLCKWAPRTPTESPLYNTASELLNASRRWRNIVVDHELPHDAESPGRRTSWVFTLIVGMGLVGLFVFFLLFDGLEKIQSIFVPPLPTLAETPQLSTPKTPIFTTTPTLTQATTLTATQTTALTSTPSPTTVAAISPSPGTYTNSILVLDESYSAANDCWAVETNLSLGLDRDEGFTRRSEGNWRFGIESGRTAEDFIQIDFSQCLNGQQVRAIALNAWIPRLELQRDLPDSPGAIDPGKEFGFFIEDTNGQRREYTIWIDKEEAMRLRVREGSEIKFDDIVSIVDAGVFKIRGSFPRYYAEFPIQIFFEFNNSGVDIVYLKQGPIQEAVTAQELDPNQMIIIHGAVRPTLDSIHKIGLIGYGGETQTVIWPLVFFGN